MEYGHNLNKDGITSVKVHHQPGGASSFSLGHDAGDGAGDDRFAHVKKDKAEKVDPAAMPVAGGSTAALDAEKAGKALVEAPTADSNPVGQSEKEEEKVEEVKKDEKPPTAGPGSFTSVKYSGNPPGGKSNFSLG